MRTGCPGSYKILPLAAGAPEVISARSWQAASEAWRAITRILDEVARPAALAMRLLAAGNRMAYGEIMSNCESLGQCVFEEPTRFYKTGLAFLSLLNGSQPNPMLVNHEETCRGREHLLCVARLASEAGAITDAKTAAARLATWISGTGLS